MYRNTWDDDKLLSRLINNKSNKSRWDYISILRGRPSEELFLKCIELTKSINPKLREIGIDILAQLGGVSRPFLEKTLDLYFNLLETEKDPEVLMSLLYGISHNNENLSKNQIQKLCSFSGSNNEFIKEGLVSALGFVNDLDAITILIQFTTDKLSHIRDWATFYIGQGERNTKNIREALWARISDKHQDTKLEAILGLAKRKDERIKEIIKRELIDGEYGTLLFEAIIETGDKEYLPLLQQNLERAKGANLNQEWIKDLENCIDELRNMKA